MIILDKDRKIYMVNTAALQMLSIRMRSPWSSRTFFRGSTPRSRPIFPDSGRPGDPRRGRGAVRR
ncbi:MAG: hypothetical protein M0C28_23540 [Candidatus Moduliflexus flocculans]|nr:hypothetical protein [Candidatus Moduliflexus flocculans]